MSVENSDRVHASLGLSFEPGGIIVRVCAGVVLASIVQVSPGMVECDLVDGLGLGEATVATSCAFPPAPFVVALVMPLRLSDRRWQFVNFRAVGDLADLGPCGFDVTWLRTAIGAEPVAVIPVPP